jgi:protein O-GlcNAc transferase
MKRFAGPLLMCFLVAAGTICFAESSALEAVRRLLTDGKRDLAVELLHNIIKKDPANFDAKILLGTTLAIEGARSESIRIVSEAVQLRPQSAAAHNVLGTTLSRFLETADAKKAFEKALALDPRFAEAHVNLALLLAQEGNLEAAGDHVDHALVLQRNTPASAYSHYLRATIWATQARFEKADKELEKAVRVRPGYAEAWSDLGWARRQLSDDSGARTAFEKAVALNPKDPLAQYRLGTAYLREGKAERAVPHLQEALTMGGADKATLYNLELALRKAGREEESLAVNAQMRNQLQASRQSTENGLQVTNINIEGIELEKQGDIHGAILKYRAALELDPTATGVRLNYGLALCRLRRWKEGIAEIQEVLRLDPNNEEASRDFYIAKEQAQADSTATTQP